LPKLRLSHTFLRATRGKISNYFQTTVVPQFWQYARYKQWMPSHALSDNDVFQVKSLWLKWSVRVPEASEWR
jgi:hypothetical protein